MKIGVVSDTHIPDRASVIPGEVLARFRGMDMVVHAGDLVEPSVLDALHKVCPDVRGVAGNMDPPELKKLLPEKLIFKAEGFTVGVTHGYGPPQRLPELVRQLFKKDKVDLIIFGHSHQPVYIPGPPAMFNPGSPTDTIFAPYRSFGIVTIGEKITTEIIRLS